MRDLTNALTVEEYAQIKGYTRLWLCPSILSNGKIGNPPYLGGLECSTSTIPAEVRNKKVEKVFKEGSLQCIIWHNDEDKPFYK